MVHAVVLTLPVLWTLGYIAYQVLGALAQLLLVLAVILFAIKLVRPRNGVDRR